ncbi:MAG TPA: hypothetical protein V6C76_06605 [Drouetiella sp.]
MLEAAHTLLYGRINFDHIDLDVTNTPNVVTVFSSARTPQRKPVRARRKRTSRSLNWEVMYLREPDESVAS